MNRKYYTKKLIYEYFLMKIQWFLEMFGISNTLTLLWRSLFKALHNFIYNKSFSYTHHNAHIHMVSKKKGGGEPLLNTNIYFKTYYIQ
jgi:hypothetical protein